MKLILQSGCLLFGVYSLADATPRRFPGAEGVLHGFNILKLHADDVSEARKGSIFNLIQTTEVSSDGEFYVPEGFNLVDAPRCSFTTEVSDVTGESSYVNEQSSHFGLDIDILGMFRHSSQSTTLTEQSYEMHFSRVSSSCRTQQAFVDPYSVNGMFSDSFLYGLDELRPCWTNLTSFYPFIDQFGTHFMTRSDFGSKYGKWYETTRFDYASAESSGSDSNADLALIFEAGFLLGGGGSDDETAGFGNSTHWQESEFEYVLGEGIPQGETTVEIGAEWLEKTSKSDLIAPIGNFELIMLSPVLSSKNMAKLNAGFARMGLQEWSDDYRERTKVKLGDAIKSYCSEFGDGDCSDPAPDFPQCEDLDSQWTAERIDAAQNGQTTEPAIQSAKDNYFPITGLRCEDEQCTRIYMELMSQAPQVDENFRMRNVYMRSDWLENPTNHLVECESGEAVAALYCSKHSCAQIHVLCGTPEGARVDTKTKFKGKIDGTGRYDCPFSTVVVALESEGGNNGHLTVICSPILESNMDVQPINTETKWKKHGDLSNPMAPIISLGYDGDDMQYEYMVSPYNSSSSGVLLNLDLEWNADNHCPKNKVLCGISINTFDCCSFDGQLGPTSFWSSLGGQYYEMASCGQGRLATGIRCYHGCDDSQLYCQDFI
mmetsp:Transcript_20472/g.33381  ORF Transcript_20472/g.33381 Transcript_20472/m.33381 type:complete len:658 (-) Transcript_20472:14-1987(-)